MILRAKLVVPMSRPPIDDGAVVVEGDSIVEIGPTADICATFPGEVRDLGEVALSPGLINAHCHLDYTGMANHVPFHGSFIEWIKALVDLKARTSEAEYVQAIQSGIESLMHSGTTTVVNVESFPALLDKLPAVPLRVWWCPELIDFNRPESPEDILAGTMEFISAHPLELGGFGLAPHAPYTVSEPLYRLCASYARGRKLPLTTHVAESEQEDDMFRRGLGPMYDYFRRAGREMTDCKRVGPVNLLTEREVLTPGCLAVHANCLTNADMQLLKSSGAHVVHCPRSHRFFRRDTPLLAGFQGHGINVCLGTDSCASNDKLSMVAEMQELAHEFPRLPAQEILMLTTVNAARALNLSDRLGCLAPGAWADIIAMPLDGPVYDPYDAVVFAEKPVCFSMVNGKVIVG